MKEFRKANGLCFKCGEKIAPGHKCKSVTSPRLNCITTEDAQEGVEIIADEVLNFLKRVDTDNTNELFLSLNAMSGGDNSRVIRLRPLNQNQVVLQLVDIGIQIHSLVNKPCLE